MHKQQLQELTCNTIIPCNIMRTSIIYYVIFSSKDAVALAPALSDGCDPSHIIQLLLSDLQHAHAVIAELQVQWPPIDSTDS